MFQGVNVNNVVKDAAHFNPDNSSQQHTVVTAVDNLKSCLESQGCSTTEVTSLCRALQTECEVDLSRRCLASKHGAYNVVFDLSNKLKTDTETLVAVLDAWCALSNGQPDILDLRGITFITDLLTDPECPEDVLLRLLTLTRHCCVMHEQNRQSFVAKGLIAAAVGVMTSHKSNLKLVKEACAVLRTLTFDDDVRVPFGKAHEHAKMIVTEGDALRVILSISKGEKLTKQ